MRADLVRKDQLVVRGIVDVEDSWLLRDYKWTANARYLNHTFYAASNRYARETEKSPLLHRAVMGHAYEMTDHRNHNGHDCRRSNLRPSTNSENGWNKGPPDIHRRSRFKGVSLNKS